MVSFFHTRTIYTELRKSIYKVVCQRKRQQSKDKTFTGNYEIKRKKTAKKGLLSLYSCGKLGPLRELAGYY